MLSLSDLRPGDLYIGPIGGLVPGVLPVGVGQLTLAGAEMCRTLRHWWNWRHVGVVVENSTGTPRLVQAMPGGAEEIELRFDRHWTGDHLYLRPAYATRGQAYAVAAAARGYVGTPYSFVDYAALALYRLRRRARTQQRYAPLAQRDALSRYVASSRRMICSQLADAALADAGWHTFNDGRLSQDVMPAELACRLLAMPGMHLRPGNDAWSVNERWPRCCASAGRKAAADPV